jgi:hypothetical protein
LEGIEGSMIDPKQLDQDRHTLRVMLDSANSEYPKLFDAEREALERIHAFLAGPSAREVDAIVDKHRLNQNDAEQTVRAIFGKT